MTTADWNLIVQLEPRLRALAISERRRPPAIASRLKDWHARQIGETAKTRSEIPTAIPRKT